jgi:hypothetical protein
MQLSLAVINACADLMVIALPIFLISQTKIDPIKKGFVIGIFSLGSIATLASFARVASTVVVATTLSNPENWVFLPIFTAVEVDIAIASASLPALTPLIKDWLQAICTYTGSDRWLRRFEADHEPRKLFDTYDLTDTKDHGGIHITHEYSVSRSPSFSKISSPSPAKTKSTPIVISRPIPYEKVMRDGRTSPRSEYSVKKSPSFMNSKSSSPKKSKSTPVVISRPMHYEEVTREGRLSPRGATYGARDMTLAEMLRTTGPDDNRRPFMAGRTPSMKGKAGEVLGV